MKTHHRRRFPAGVRAVLATILSMTLPLAALGSAAAAPTTIRHKFGSTSVPAEAERVVSLGYLDHDFILALGVTPVAVRYWFGDEPHAVFPWARDELGEAEPEVLNMPFGQLDYERIAALRPDLIMAVYSGITEEEYRALSRIAPTVAQPAGFIDFGTPWQEATRTIGRALGRAAQAERLVAGLEARFEAARQEHPEWQGRRVAVVAAQNNGQVGVFASSDVRSRFFTSLGFRVPEAFDDLAGERFYANISKERLDLLDQDLLVFHQLSYLEGGRDTIEADPLWRHLGALREGRAVFLEPDLDAALAFSSVLSLEYVLDALIPRLEAALDGDPASDPNPR